MKKVQEADLKGKRVFLRVDFNVPMTDGEITDDNRIKAVLPTIKYILDKGGRIIIGTHLGRPEGQTDLLYSLWPVANRLGEQLNIRHDFDSPQKEYVLSENIMMLENLRFDAREEDNNPQFGEDLANMTTSSSGDLGVYVNDAFAVSHRANASVEAITKFIPSYAGLLMQAEVENLSKITEDPEKPFILVIGGVKVEDKAGVIDKLAPMTDKILLGGGVANTFVKAKGEDVGGSVYDAEMVDKCKEILEKFGEKIVLPVDSVKELGQSGGFKILDIGAQTRTNFAIAIRGAKTVFWNGSLGYSEDPRYQGGMSTVAKAMNEADAVTVIAGGDTVGFVKEEGLDKKITFLSTGGGAALDFLAGMKLPGIEALQ
jgi:3-phosphoglycerate kinase